MEPIDPTAAKNLNWGLKPFKEESIESKRQIQFNQQVKLGEPKPSGYHGDKLATSWGQTWVSKPEIRKKNQKSE